MYTEEMGYRKAGKWGLLGSEYRQACTGNMGTVYANLPLFLFSTASSAGKIPKIFGIPRGNFEKHQIISQACW